MHDNTLILKIYVKPNAKKSQLIGIKDNELHIALHAKPQEGEANKELIHFLSDEFDIPKSQIEIVKGHQSRHKTVRLPAVEKLKTVLNRLIR